MSDAPTFDELPGAERILVMLKKRRQVLLEQQAQHGINTSPGIRIEIDATNEDIKLQLAEIKRIKTDSAVDHYSLAEAKYRELLAETWNTDRGLPTVVGLERLERMRLEQGVKPERAQEFKQDIRTRLAKETLDKLDYPYLADYFHTELYNIQAIVNADEARYPRAFTQLRLIGKALRLDTSLTHDHFFKTFPDGKVGSYYFDQAIFGKLLYRVNNVSWLYKEEAAIFQPFVEALPKDKTKR